MFKTHLKKIIVILLVTLAFGSLGIKMATGVDGPKVQELSLQQAIDLGLKNNPDLKIAKLKVDSAKIAHDQASKDAISSYSAEDKYGGNSQTGMAIYVNPTATKVALELAQKNEEIAEKSLKLSVENAYYNLLKAQRNLEIKTESLNYFQDQLKIAQVAYQIGTKAKVDVLTLESAVAGYQADVANAENTCSTSQMELNRIIGLDLDTPLKLTTKFTESKVGKTINLDQEIKDALADNIEILSAKKNLEVKQAMVDYSKKYQGSGVGRFAIESAAVDTKIADVTVQKQEIATTALVKQSYLTLLSLEKMIEWQTKDVTEAKENARIFGVKYAAGLATSLDAKKASIDLESAEESLSESIYNYNLLVSKFKYDLFFTSSSGGLSSSAQ